jgi:hypothetical protein
VLGNASSHPAVSTGADCQKLCEAHPDCDVWQLGSAHRCGHRLQFFGIRL